MSLERQSRIHELFAAAIDEEPPEREAFLRRECGDDVELFDEVRSLLSHHDVAEGFIDTPVIHKALEETDLHVQSAGRKVDADAAMPDQIGAYRILRRLGEGGMGVVYLAEQKHPRRIVALKVIRSGVMSPRVLRRFEHEAQVLGRLQHPGIAQIFEAGTARVLGQTQPFFALEYIEGLSLSEYVDKERLGVRARLSLIARICDAVHHAHQKGVIHRDLKPGNILVDATGQPKILDFGVARVTDADVNVTTLQTDIGQLVGTVPYMSPEQVAGNSDALDTRSDVYALGVVCYQLLTGRLPHDLARKVITEAARIIQEEEPAPISMINRSLRGDIETIIAKTLEKDRDRRYQSASELAADIRRYLNDEPIVARPASAFYQIRKFTRRNKVVVTATMSVIAALSGGLIYSVIQRDKAISAELAARTEAERAKREAKKAARVVGFLENMLSHATPANADDRDLTVAEVMETSAAEVERELADEPEVLASVQTTIGRTLTSLARYDEAEVQLERALNAQRQLLGDEHPDTITTIQVLGTLRKLQGRYPEADELMTQAVELSKRVHGERSKRTAQIVNDMGTVRLRLGDFKEALADFQQAADIVGEIEGEESTMMSEVLGNMGYALSSLERYKEAEAALVHALEISRAMTGRRTIATASMLNNLGYVRRRLGDVQGAIDATREAQSTDEAIYGRAHPRTIRSLSNLAVMLRSSGALEEAERLYREVVDRYIEALGPDHPSVGNALTNLGFLLSITDRETEACEKLAEALRIFRASLPADHVNIGNTASKYGDALMGLGRYADAEPLFRESLGIFEKALGSDSPAYGSACSKLGRVLIAIDRGDEGEPLVIRGVDTLIAGGHAEGEAERGVADLAAYYESINESEKALSLRDKLKQAIADATPMSDAP
ncbi:MAG: serine/threonine protein kinase [Phycisphaerales bacterium]|nr:serine/threonine protein kinase [Phycisphaerales bacterium]MCB9862177.1 serine/threonine protein kinase [Phycisphaerales bacterium]